MGPFAPAFSCGECVQATSAAASEGMQSYGSDASPSLAATLPHALTKMQRHSSSCEFKKQFKKSSSEPLMAHQAGLGQRNTPHPNQVAQTRWPTAGWKYGGVIDLQDARRHAFDFGYRQNPRSKFVRKEVTAIPEMTLDELRNFLTNKFGSLMKAFNAMDFFGDGYLSAIEWQEGLYNNLANSFGEESHKFRMAIVPRKQFNARMQHLFAVLDEDGDGLISFAEFSRPFLEPEESPWNFDKRREIEKASHVEEKKALLQKSMLTGSMRAKGPPEHHRDPDDSSLAPLRDFAVYVFKSFKDLDAAFAAFDVGGNGQLNLAEFVHACRRMKYGGDADQLFKMLDIKDTGTISKQDLAALRQLPWFVPPSSSLDQSLSRSNLSASLGTTKRDLTFARKLRSPINDPNAHECGQTFSSTDMVRPLGENMRTAAGFYTFPRLATGRHDALLHPEELPGEYPDRFSPDHGPGCCEKGPEYFPYLGLTEHPRRGDKWKMGATVNRTERFGPLVPSTQGANDRDLSAMSFNTYEGRRPTDGFKVSNTGGISWAKSPMRLGVTVR